MRTARTIYEDKHMSMAQQCVRTLTAACLFMVLPGFSACAQPDDSSGEVAALLSALVASGVVVLGPDRGNCSDGETTTEDGCTNQEGD